MLVSKKIDNFINELEESVENVEIRVNYDLDNEFDNYMIVVNRRQKDKKRYMFKIYNKNHMTSIGEYCYKYFKTQNEMIDEILKRVTE
jgi:hypothetical protein